MDRRTFLKAAGALAMTAGCAPDIAPFGAIAPLPVADGLPKRADDARFPFGVQAGGVEPTSIRLWSFATEGSAYTAWLWRIDDDQIQDVVRVPLDRDADGYLVYEATDLLPGATYCYAFATDDAGKRSVVGRFVTAPDEDDLRPLTLACATCTSWRKQPWIALERLAAFDFDLTLHMGDMVYADNAKDQDEYRKLWLQALADPGYRALLPRAAKLHVWDDHEFWNNPDPEANPERIALGKAAFFQNTAAHQGEDGKLWRSYRFGRTAEIILLDARTERRPSTIGTDDLYLSTAQLDFVEERLRTSPARFKVMMNSLPITRMPDLYPSSDDRWQGYRTQRDQILEVLEDDFAARGTLFLSGDFHMGFVAHAETEGLHRRIIDIAVGPSGNSENPFGDGPLQDIALTDAQFDFITGRMCATLVTLDPARGEVDVKFVDAETGETLHEQTLTPGEEEA